MELKCVEKLNSIVNCLTSAFGCEAVIDTDFAYYHDCNVITWSPFVMADADMYFQEYVGENYPHITADIFLWSLLHEIGHHVTYDTFSKRSLKRCRRKKKWIEDILKDVDKRTEHIFYHEYFATADEEMATKWAAKFMENNSELVSEFWNVFIKEFHNFLVLNAVED